MNYALNALRSGLAGPLLSAVEVLPLAERPLQQTQFEALTSAPVAPNQPGDPTLEMVSLQTVVSQRQEAAQIASNVSRSMDDAASRIAKNLLGNGPIPMPGPVEQPGAEVALNPQPLPPRWLSSVVGSLGNEVMLNPQPLPPRWAAESLKRLGQEVALNPQPLPPEPPSSIGRRGEEVMLNPQPLPPRWVLEAIKRPGEEVMLNPQPLPPRWLSEAVSRGGEDASLKALGLRTAQRLNTEPFRRLYEEVMLNPQPLPPVADALRRS